MVVCGNCNLGLHLCNGILSVGNKMGIEVKNLTKEFNDKKVLNNISFKVEDGETTTKKF